MTGKSYRQIGDDNLGRLSRYLESAERIPDRNGKASISAIALAAGVDRQVLYREEAKVMIAAAVTTKGLGMPAQQRKADTAVPAWATKRIHNLEQQLASSKVEVSDLRQQLQRYEHLERHMATSGILPR